MEGTTEGKEGREVWREMLDKMVDCEMEHREQVLPSARSLMTTRPTPRQHQPLPDRTSTRQFASTMLLFITIRDSCVKRTAIKRAFWVRIGRSGQADSPAIMA